MKVKTIAKIVSIVAVTFLAACGTQVTQPGGPKMPQTKPEDALFQKADTFYEQKEFDRAVKTYLEYIETYPEGAMLDAALLKLGMSYRELAQNDEALNYFNQLIETMPDSPLVMDARIETLAVYLRQGRFQELEQNAFDILEKSLHDTQIQRINGILGDNYAAAGDPIKAVHYYDRMLQLSTGKSRIDSFDRIQSAVDQLDKEQTQKLLNSLEIGGARSHLLFRLGNLHLAEKNIGGARTAFEEILQKYPNFRENENIAKTLDSIASGEIFKPYTLGCLLPLSGSYAAYGQRALQGIEMALIHFSQKAPELMPKLVVEDTRSNPERAKKALETMAREGVAAIIGPMVTAEQVAMDADAFAVPIITLTQKEYITDSGPYVFRNFITPEMQVKALVNYTAETLGDKRFAILYPNENYGVTFMDLFWDEAVVHNGMVVGVESYDAVQTDFADAIKKLVGRYYSMSQDKRNQALAHAEFIRNPEDAFQLFDLEGNYVDPDAETEVELDFSDAAKEPEELESIVDFNAVFIPDSPKKVGLIIPQLAYYDIRDVHLLGTNIWHSDSLIRMSRKYLKDAIVVDGFFAESEDPVIREFVSSFHHIYNEKPEIIAATAYDCASIILDLISDPTIEMRSQVKDRLLTMPPFNGITGKTTFRPNGDVSKDLFVLGIKKGRFVEIGRLNPYPANKDLMSEEMDAVPDHETVNGVEGQPQNQDGWE